MAEVLTYRGFCSRRTASGSLWFLAALFLSFFLLSFFWVALFLPSFNSEHLGCDACHHALLIHAFSLPNLDERAFLTEPFKDYPRAAHWLAAQLMPLLGNDAFKAMRCLSIFSVFCLLGVQFHLFRRVMPAGVALLVLLVWQYLSCLTRTADIYFYMEAFFYAEAFGTLFLWLTIACISWAPKSAAGRRAMTGAAILLALLAYLCHIVPGLIALGGVGLVFLLGFVTKPGAWSFVPLAILILAGLWVIFGTGQLTAMQGWKGMGGALIFRRYPLIFLWLPTALAAAFLCWRRWRSQTEKDSGQNLSWVLTLFLLAGGLVHGYCAYEWAIRHTAAVYSVKKFFHFLFPAASMLWLIWLVPASKKHLAGLGSSSSWHVTLNRWYRPGYAALLIFLLFINLSRYFAYEFRGPTAGSDRNPVLVVNRLRQELPQFRQGTGQSECIYYDPLLPQSSVFVNIVGLRRTFGEAYQVMTSLREGKEDWPRTLEDLHQRVAFSRLIMPQAQALNSWSGKQSLHSEADAPRHHFSPWPHHGTPVKVESVLGGFANARDQVDCWFISGASCPGTIADRP